MQRFLIVNLDLREYLDPAVFGDGGGLLEFATSGSGAMLALAMLLASGCESGSQEPASQSDLIGAWAEHRIVITGDGNHDIFTGLTLAELRSLPIGPSLHEVATRLYTDISLSVLAIISKEPYERRALETKGVLSRP